MILSQGAGLKSRIQGYEGRTSLEASSGSSDMEPWQCRHDDSAVGHNLNAQNGLPDGISDLTITASQWLLT